MYLFLQALVLWGFSVLLRDSSLFDRFWGLSFLCISLLVFPWREAGLEEWFLLMAVGLWSLRLSLYITMRNWNQGEDKRYAAIRAKHPKYAIKSFFMIFGLQSVMAYVVSWPLFFQFTQESQWSSSTSNLAHGMGAFLFCIGFGLEVIADEQMRRFRLNPQGLTVMRTGLWRYSRHPNYFGECLLWWGFSLYAFPHGPWWMLISPLLMTYLLVSFTGKGPLEEDLRRRKPQYRHYVQTTSSFVPWFPKLKA